MGYLERESEREIRGKVSHLRALHLVVQFQDFWWHVFRDIGVLDAARRFFYGVFLRRFSVSELYRPTPTLDFDDSCADVFLTGRASFCVFKVFLDSALFGTFPEDL